MRNFQKSVIFGLALIAPALCVSSGIVRAGEALITNQPADSVTVLDTETMKPLGDVKLSGKPAGIALSADKTRAYVTAPEGRVLFEIDTAARRLVRKLDIGGGPLGIAAHPSKPEVYVADWYAHKIAVVDASSLTVAATIPVGQSPSGLAVTPDGKLLISADRDSDQISIIDIASRAVVATVATGKRPFGVTIDATGTLAYTANVASDDVTVIDVAAHKAVRTIAVGKRPYAVALTGGRGFVTDQYGGSVSVFDVQSGKVEKAIDACDHPEGIEADAAGAFVYVACWGDNIVLKIDAKTLQILGKASVGNGPRAFGKFLR